MFDMEYKHTEERNLGRKFENRRLLFDVDLELKGMSRGRGRWMGVSWVDHLKTWLRAADFTTHWGITDGAQRMITPTGIRLGCRSFHIEDAEPGDSLWRSLMSIFSVSWTKQPSWFCCCVIAISSFELHRWCKDSVISIFFHQAMAYGSTKHFSRSISTTAERLFD